MAFPVVNVCGADGSIYDRAPMPPSILALALPCILNSRASRICYACLARDVQGPLESERLQHGGDDLFRLECLNRLVG